VTTREDPGPTPVLSGEPWTYLQGVGGIGAEVLAHGVGGIGADVLAQGVGGIGADVLAHGVGGIGAEVLAHGVGGIGAEVLAMAFKPMALVTTKSANTATADNLLIDPPKGIFRAESISDLMPSAGKL
jgi:hypothetical protein